MMRVRHGMMMIAALLAMALPAMAQAPAKGDAAERARVKELVREILKENPELV
ncbi:MAG: hypothetical protein JO021_00545, partial [Alphaproteobacteria bacterium]|nr:hypothetical protein [Alphaproteobacteria bacterium]